MSRPADAGTEVPLALRIGGLEFTTNARGGVDVTAREKGGDRVTYELSPEKSLEVAAWLGVVTGLVP